MFRPHDASAPRGHGARAGRMEVDRPMSPPRGWNQAGRSIGPLHDVSPLFAAGGRPGRKVHAVSTKLFLENVARVPVAERMSFRLLAATLDPALRGARVVCVNLSQIPDSAEDIMFTHRSVIAARSDRPVPMDESSFAEFFIAAFEKVNARPDDDVLLVVKCTHGRNRSGGAVVRLRLLSDALRTRCAIRRADIAARLRELAEHHKAQLPESPADDPHGGVTDPDHIAALYTTACLQFTPHEIRARPQPPWARLDSETPMSGLGYMLTSSEPLVPAPITAYLNPNVAEAHPLRRAGSFGGFFAPTHLDGKTHCDMFVCGLVGSARQGAGHPRGGGAPHADFVFPGPMPHEASRDYLRANHQRLWATPKADGERGFLVLTAAGAYVILRRNNASKAYVARMPAGGPPLIVLDVEFMARRGAKPMCYAFDVVMFNDRELRRDESFLHKTWIERKVILDAWFRDYSARVAAVLEDESPYLSGEQRHSSARTTPYLATLEVRVKPTVPFARVAEVMQPGAVPADTEVDGVILYHEEHTLERAAQPHQIRKVKLEQTIDVRCADPAGGSVWVAGGGLVVAVRRFDWGKFAQLGGNVIYELRIDSVIDTRVPDGRADPERVDERSVGDREVVIDATVVRQRPDKTGGPNNKVTVLNIMRAAIDPILSHELVRIAEGRNADKRARVETASSSGL